MPRTLSELLDALPEPLGRQVFTHASWVDDRATSYERLAFLGDSVLGLTVTQHLVPRLDAERYGAGELTKLRAQAVSGAACRRVALELGADDRLRERAPGEVGRNVEALLRTERVLASVTEAIIGACFETFGWEETSAAVEAAFRGEVDRALDGPEDFKSALQERVAQRGHLVGYEVVEEQGPPHERTFRVVALVEDAQVGQGTGRSKKEAEQAAAREALDDMDAR